MRMICLRVAQSVTTVSLAMIVLSGCGGGSMSAPAAAATSLPARSGAQESSSSAAAPQPAIAPGVAGAAGAAPGAPVQAKVAASQSGAPPALPNVQTAPSLQMLIQTATMVLEVDRPADALDQIEAVAKSVQGQRTQSSSAYRDNRLFITATLVVPVDHFGDAVAQLRKFGREVSENITSQDVGEEFVDVQAQLTTLTATRQHLQALLDKATKVDEILAVQREITNVQSQMDRLQGRVNFLTRKSAMSTINVTLQMPPTQSAPTGVLGWQPSRTVQTAILSVITFWQQALDGAICVAVALGPPLALFLLGRLLYLRTRPVPPAPTTTVTP